MRSIRRTLVISLALLVSTGLLGIAVAMDQIAADTMEVRAAIQTAAIEADYQAAVQKEKDKFDHLLLSEARTLTGQMQSLYASRFEQEQRKFRVAYQLSEHLVPCPWSHLMIYETSVHSRGALYFASLRSYFANLLLDDSLGQMDSDGEIVLDPSPRYFQINIASRTRSIWKSASLGEQTLPVQYGAFDAQKLEDWELDDVVIHGQPSRRVVFRSPIILPWRPSGVPRQSSSRSGGRGDSDRDRDRGDRIGPPAPTPPQPVNPPPTGPITPAQMLAGLPRIYAHNARPLSMIDSVLEDYNQQKQLKLTDLQDEISHDQFQLRATVFSIGFGALAIILIGGWWLVQRGLQPLDRLSEAVSQVSERDFRLMLPTSELSKELVPIHSRLCATLDQLRNAFEREKQAVADISHELRTPVAALLTTLDVSLRKTRTAEQYRNTLMECRDISRQLGQLVERVMTLAYIDAGHMQVTHCRVPAYEVASGCASVIKPLAAARGITFRMEADPDLELETDRDKLREVLMNLLHNAVEYNNDGGNITLNVYREGASSAVFEVVDSGIGMDESVQAKIFERFYRADPSRTETGVHAGLGLAIVKEYVERLGGEILVESQPGQGSTFKIVLPAVPAHQEASLAIQGA